MFKHGRTETLRTFSRESKHWILSMLNQLDSVSAAKLSHHFLKLALMNLSHRTANPPLPSPKPIHLTASECAKSWPADALTVTHFLGLRLLLRPRNGESALFGDDSFKRSSCWKLSTSGLSVGLLFKGTAFGTVYEDGYGIFSSVVYGWLLTIFIFSFRFICFRYGQIRVRVQVLIYSYFYRKVQAIDEAMDVCHVWGCIKGRWWFTFWNFESPLV